MSGIFVAQLNEQFRLVLVPAVGKTARAWCLEHLNGDAWQSDFVVRSADMLRWRLAGIEPIAPAAAAILAVLLPRVDCDMTLSPEERRGATLAKRRKRPRVANLETGAGSTTAQPPDAVPIAPAPVPPAVPIAAAVVSRLCDNCGAEFTPAARSFRARRCSPACRREFQTRYQRDRRASDEGFHERARLDQAARRQASKAGREAREIALATAAAQPIDSDLAEYWRINHGVRL